MGRTTHRKNHKQKVSKYKQQTKDTKNAQKNSYVKMLQEMQMNEQLKKQHEIEMESVVDLENDSDIGIDMGDIDIGVNEDSDEKPGEQSNE